MKELIKITETNGKSAVSARELYDFLGFEKSQWSRWYKKNIIDNDFAIENTDYQTFDIVSNGNETKDFVLSLDFAKRISMLARTEKGEEIRNYFIEREKVAKNPIQNLSKIDIAKMLIESEEEKERLQMTNQLQEQELKKQAPKIEYVDNVLQSKSTYNTNQIAKELGMSAVTLNRRLQDFGVQYKQNGTWLLYHKYQDKGYTKTKTFNYTDSDGNSQTSMQTVWTEKGRVFIHHNLKKRETA